MVKHTQTIRHQQPTNCLSVFDHFAGFVFKGLRCPLSLYFVTAIHLFEYQSKQIMVNVETISILLLLFDFSLVSARI